jgi:hypothetical protein
MLISTHNLYKGNENVCAEGLMLVKKKGIGKKKDFLVIAPESVSSN